MCWISYSKDVVRLKDIHFDWIWSWADIDRNGNTSQQVPGCECGVKKLTTIQVSHAAHAYANFIVVSVLSTRASSCNMWRKIEWVLE